MSVELLKFANILPRYSKFAKFINKLSHHRNMGLFNSTAQRPASDMSGPIVDFVKQTISNNKVVIFSKTYCPYCNMAKEQFKKVQYNDALYVELDERDDGEEIQSVLGSLTGARTVPRVFIDGKFVGGGTDVKKLYDNGRLVQLIA